MSEISSGHPPHFVFNAAHVARVHTCLAYAAFTTSLLVGCALHYVKIVKNGVAGYPQEWFPSVSATIGDWYPERNLFQVCIALVTGPRLAITFFQYCIHKSPTSYLPTVVFLSGIVRTVSLDGWVYVTSSDDHDVHDVCMITYIVCNIPWMFGTIACTPTSHPAIRKKRIYTATAFFASIIPMIYLFIQHEFFRIPGAYTRYSFFEWGLIFFDILFDAFTEEEFGKTNLQFSLGSSIRDSSTTNEISLKQSNGNDPVDSQCDVTQTHVTPVKNPSVVEIRRPFSNWRQPISFLADVYLSYIFWSIFTALIPTLFYFSVWELAITGSEVALFSTLSPIFLAITPFLNWARTHGGLTTLHLLSFSGLLAYLSNSPLHRLFIVSFASIIVVIRQVVDWSGNNAIYHSILASLGLTLASLSKHANHSNNPVWPIVNEASGGYNKIGLIFAVLALTEFVSRPSETPSKPNEKQTELSSSTLSWWRGALSFGSLLFIVSTYLGDAGTLIAWSWTGYENGLPRGPLGHIHGSMVLVAQTLGLLLALASLSPSGLILQKLLSHPIWFIYGVGSAFVMYRYRDWIGFAGGLNFALFTMSIIPHSFQFTANAAGGSIGKTYFMAMLVYCLLSLAYVWTVAYAFVPGGVYLRERTDLIVIAQMAFLSLNFKWPSFRHNLSFSLTTSSNTRAYARFILGFISTASVLVTLYRTPVTAPQPWRPGPRIFRAGIWTVHFGIDNEGHDSQRRVLNLIRDMEVDVVGLLEADLHRVIYGNRDLTRVMVEEMNYYVDLGPGPNSHTWGAVLLSKFPIINSTHHLLPSPHGELAPAISAVLDVWGTLITVVVSHNGQEEDKLDRELQSTELARIMSESPYPVVFLGYVVTRPHAPRPNPYRILVEDGNVHDIDKDDRDRWCQYILYRGLYRTGYARISRSTITDTELQIGQFMLPKHGYVVTNETEAARYLRSYKEALAPEHWFPMEYYGNKHKGGVNGHFYHVFNTPLYYNLPKDAAV